MAYGLSSTDTHRVNTTYIEILEELPVDDTGHFTLCGYTTQTPVCRCGEIGEKIHAKLVELVKSVNSQK